MPSTTVSLESPVLHLVVPGFAAAWKAAGADGGPKMAGLQRIVRRGNIERCGEADDDWETWQLQALSVLGLEADPLHAIAPLEWLGAGGKPSPGTWLRAEFIHVEVGSHAARVHPIAVDAADAMQLRGALVDHFAASGFAVEMPPHPPASGAFYLHAVSDIEASCPIPDPTADVRERLPIGREGAALRRLFTEAQMLLHEHPVNIDRERAGLRTANAIWLSGLGRFGADNPGILPPLWADDSWCVGLARLHGSAIDPLPVDARALPEATDRGLVVIPLDQADPLAALTSFDQRWIAPLLEAISRRRLKRLELWLGQWRLHIDGVALRRFWRRGSLKEALS